MYESIGGAPPTRSRSASAPAIRRRASSPRRRSRRPHRRPADGAAALRAADRARSAPPAARTSSTRTPSSTASNPAFRREAQNVGGVFAQDQWRISPKLTFNYGLRWEFSGAAINTNDVYSGPTIGDLLGPSTALFQPGTLNGVADPQIYLRPKPYKARLQQPGAERRRGVEPGQARRLARQAARHRASIAPTSA